MRCVSPRFTRTGASGELRGGVQMSESRPKTNATAPLTNAERIACFENASRYARDALLLIDKGGRLLECNDAAVAAYGYTREELLRLTLRALLTAEARPFMKRDLQLAWHAEGHVFETVHLRKDGTAFPVEVSARPITVGQEAFLVSMVRNIAERKRYEARLEEMALRDALTGLANRRLLGERVTQALGYAQRNKSAMALLYLDLDGFKQVNDALGHDAGDLLLKAVAVRLVAAVREIDTVARVGGDEFVIGLWPLHSIDDIDIISKKILAAVSRPFDIKQQAVNVTTSIGVSVFPYHGKDVESLLKSADLVLYRAKRDGRNTYRILDLPASPVAPRNK